MLFMYGALEFRVGYLCVKVPMPAHRFPSFVNSCG